ncbi:hypothetical protein ACWJJH_03880 [Endozoicomonadaceae bacterium StTr2]
MFDIRKLQTALVFTLYSLLLAGNSVAAVQQIDEGVITPTGRYQNDYLDFSIAIPKGWAVKTQAQMQEIQKEGTDLLAGDDENLKKIIKASSPKTVNLFAFSKYEMGAPVESNPSVASVAENVQGAPGIKRGSDYLFHVKRMLQNSNMEYHFDTGFERTLGNTTFDVLPATLKVGSVTVYQEYTAIIVKGYALALVLTFRTPEEREELYRITNQLQAGLI